MRKALISVVFCAVLAALAASAHADPRWWWNDRKIPLTDGVNIADADIDVESTYSGNFRGYFYVAWIVPASGLTQGAVWLTASFNGGCSFCDPVKVADTSGTDSTKVSIAVAALPGVYSIQIAYPENGLIKVATDSQSLPDDSGAPDVKCAQLQGVAANRVLHTVSAGAGGASYPDITGDAYPGLFVHFYVVWQAATAAGTDVFFARDLAGNGSWGAERNLTGTLPAPHDFLEPSVTIDFFTGIMPPTDSAANVAFHDGNAVLYLKSNNSGTDFSGTGAPPETPPLQISEPAAGHQIGRPALDSGNMQNSTMAIWHGVVFEDASSPAGPFEARFDAKNNDQPAAANPDWGADRAVAALPDLPLGGPAASVFSRAMPLPGGLVPTYTFFEDRAAPAAEIHYRGGVLDNASGADLTRFPITAVRAHDPSASRALPLTHCLYDEPTGDCASTRPSPGGGRARAPACDENWSDDFVVWIDDREGGDAVWYKRTDRTVWSVTPTLAADCTSPWDARITASWTPLSVCGSAAATGAERLLRYRVYYATDPGGPYINTDLAATDPTVPDTVLIDAVSPLPSPVTADLTGLDPNTDYYVIVVPEDEARNLRPGDFDPLLDLASSPPGELTIRTPDCGGAPRCLHRVKLTSANPPTPPKADIFTTPNARGIGLDPAHPSVESPYVCPFQTADRDPEQVLTGPDPLIFYQVDDAPAVLLEKDIAGGTIVFYF